jgi:NADPH:quinone reductase-like Zn-dependent oxidoreductase
MSITARLAILPPGATELEIETVDLPAPRPYEVVIEQRAFGICHSQLDLIDRPGRTEPLVIGHESTGVVVAVGSQVTHVAPQDEVLLTWLPRLPDADRAPTSSRIPLRGGRVAVPTTSSGGAPMRSSTSSTSSRRFPAFRQTCPASSAVPS